MPAPVIQDHLCFLPLKIGIVQIRYGLNLVSCLLSRAETPKRDPSPIRNLSSSKRVKCTKDQIFGESDLKKTCHQCRQSRKRSDFYVAPCKNLKKKKNKICSVNICSKCLFNRYGEKAEEVVLLSDWKCPKCRDICNCSSCSVLNWKNISWKYFGMQCS